MKQKDKTNLEKSVTRSLDGDNEDLFPYFAYLLQDLWEIGASPAIIKKLLRKNTDDKEKMQILDLGCGKGAVSIQLAKQFDCQCLLLHLPIRH